MALTFPRDMTTDKCWEVAKLWPHWRQELSVQAGGIAQAKDLGSPLWKAQFESYPLRRADFDALEADFITLGGLVRSFLLVPPRNRRPRADTGTGAVTAAVAEIRSDAAALKLSGLPAAYTLTAGDFLSIATTAGGYELVRVVRDKLSDGAGETGWVEVGPTLRPGILVGDVVTLTDPVVEMRLEADGLRSTKVARSYHTFGFNAVQVVR